MRRQRVTVLGSTGSIGESTLDVLSRNPDHFEVFALGANNRHQAMLQQCLRYKPRYAVLRDHAAARSLADDLAGSSLETRVLSGEEGLQQVAADRSLDGAGALGAGAVGRDALEVVAAAATGERLGQVPSVVEQHLAR